MLEKGNREGGCEEASEHKACLCMRVCTYVCCEMRVRMNERERERVTCRRSFSAENPSPYTVLARWSDHWPNFGDVLVKFMLAVMVLLIRAWEGRGEGERERERVTIITESRVHFVDNSANFSTFDLYEILNIWDVYINASMIIQHVQVTKIKDCLNSSCTIINHYKFIDG